MHSILSIALDSPISEARQVEYERVIADILKEHSFSIENATPPFSLSFKRHDQKWWILVNYASGEVVEWGLSLRPLRLLFRDYGIICESYMNAVQRSDPMQIEAIDMGRRGLHNEGAEVLQAMLAPHATIDFETARKFFTLLYVVWGR